jgi:hypothetical protein
LDITKYCLQVSGPLHDESDIYVIVKTDRRLLAFPWIKSGPVVSIFAGVSQKWNLAGVVDRIS